MPVLIHSTIQPFYPMKTQLGSELSPSVRKECLARFVHRFTGQHRPAWANRPDSRTYPVQFVDDEDWLAHTRFTVTKSGKLDGRFGYCESSPTWPLNPELRK